MFEVVEYPSPILLEVCQPVDEFGPDIKRLVADMAEAMYASQGVGLAAPQVGITRRVILIDPSAGDGPDDLTVMINPCITWVSPEVEASEEGCLSLPGVRVEVPRHLAVEVEYYDVDGNKKLMRYGELAARIVQHEVDHLLGILMVNRVGFLARKLALKDLGKNR